MIRIIRNRARIGKRWLVVEGDYWKVNNWNPARWTTALQISEHDTKAEAEASLPPQPRRGETEEDFMEREAAWANANGVV